MGKMLTLTAEDGHTLGAYRADPDGTPRGGLVVIQEIFGVNIHIRNVCDGFAADGYAAIAPALFDRVKPGIELGYSQEDVAEAREIRGQLDWDGPVRDIAAAAEAVKDAGKVGVVGYCWGGSLAWLAATRLGLPSVGYYGGQIVNFADEQLSAPVLLHFGKLDQMIPPEDRDKIRTAHPEVPIFEYDAGHGFNCDMRESFSAEASKFARTRTMEFLAENVG